MPAKIEIPAHSTTDLVEAATLLTLPGCEILGCDWADPTTVRWIIVVQQHRVKEDEVRDLLDELHERKALVEPYAFAKALRKAKRAMYEFMNSSPKAPAKKSDGSEAR